MQERTLKERDTDLIPQRLVLQPNVMRERMHKERDTDFISQRHVLKQKELLERTQKERAKIAEEMRSAFTELTLRQEKLDVCKMLISKLDHEVRLSLQAVCMSVRHRAHTRS